MKRSLIFLLMLTACATTSQKTTSGFVPPVHEEYVLDNGLKVLLLQDERLPYISYTLMLSQGAASEPESASGLAHLTAALLERGTKTKSATVIAEKLGDMATDFDANVSKDVMYFKVSSLNSYQRELLEVFSEILLQPSFPETEFQREKKRLLSQVAKISDSPSAFADMVFDNFLYANTPYSTPVFGTIKTVSSLQLSNVQRYHKETYVPQIATLAVVGKFTSDIREQIQKNFGGWSGSGVAAKPIVMNSKLLGKNFRVVDKPHIVQAQIRFGHFGVARNHPDYLTLKIANNILGSGFMSRLVTRVRDELGLTYHISSNIESHQNFGTIEIKTFTQNARVGEAVRETLKTYEEFHDRGVTAQEVEDAKNFSIGQFPQIVETPEAWIYNLMAIRMYGMPDSYLTNFAKNVRAITLADVNRVIKSYMKPRDLKIMAFTTSKDVIDQLREYKNIEVRKYTDFQ